MSEVKKSVFEQNISELLKTSDSFKDYIDEDLLINLQSKSKNILDTYALTMTANRELKLGIVGRVKAGKSSFLNALLFNGEDILPKAATPMTAALTKISYAASKDEQQAIIYYYTEEEWLKMEENNRQYNSLLEKRVQERQDELKNRPLRAIGLNNNVDINKIINDVKESLPFELKVSHELVEMAKEQSLLYTSLPKTDNKNYYVLNTSSKSTKDFMKNLNDYVGANGKYTPMVKYLELKINDNRLSGVEIVDTPGLNDPVASRVAVTNKFLKECDSVLLLSNTSRFLDAQDKELIVEDIKRAGVAKAYVIGTMMDDAILEYSKPQLGLGVAYKDSKKGFILQYRNILTSIEKEQKGLPASLDINTEPIFVSSRMYGIALKLLNKEQFSKDEVFTIDRYKKSFADFERTLSSSDDYFSFAGINEIKTKVYEPVLKQKEQIIQEKIAKYQKEQALEISDILDSLVDELLNRKKLLEGNSIANLKEKIEVIQKNLLLCKNEVKNIFEDLIHKCELQQRSLQINLRESIARNKDISVKKDVKTEEYSTGIILKDYHYETYVERSASTADVNDNLEKYNLEAQKLITATLGDLINEKDLALRLKAVIFNTFENANEEYNKADIVGPIQGLLRELTIPEPNFTFVDEAKTNLNNKFSSTVYNSSIDDLKQEQDRQLTNIYNNLEQQIKDIVEDVINLLKKKSLTFTDVISNKVQDNYKKLQEQLESKDSSLAQYEKILETVKNFKNIFLA